MKALSIALKGDSVFAMLKELRWEGHPAVWYLLLRAAHTLLPHPQVLLVVSIVVAALAVLTLLLCSPFRLPLLALILIARFSLYDYSVMSRNYGISMLFLFLFAACYERHRSRDCLLGVLLSLLANCNVHSALLAGGLLLFWLVDILSGEAADRMRNIRIFLYNAVLAVIGVITCFITVFPTLGDSIGINPNSVTFKTVLRGIFAPALQFDSWGLPDADKLATLAPPLGNLLTSVESLILFGSTLGLIRRTGAFIAALTTLAGLSLAFLVLSPGLYRHQALWLVFLICMYWLAMSGNASDEPVSHEQVNPFVGRLSTTGTALFLFLLLLQSVYSVQKLFGIGVAPIALENRINNVNSILAGHPELKQAVIIADPDFLVETLPYYVSNPTYLLREQRYGNVVHFTRNAQLDLTLGDVLSDGRRLQQNTGKPVVILLSHEINPSLPGQVYREGYNWTFSITPDQARAFRSSTRFLEYRASAGTSENYYAYALQK